MKLIKSPHGGHRWFSADPGLPRDFYSACRLGCQRLGLYPGARGGRWEEEVGATW